MKFFRVLGKPILHKIKAREVFFLGDIEGQHLEVRSIH